MSPTDDSARRYVLGQMPADQTQAFEEEVFTTDEGFERLSMVEAALLDAYCRGELAESEDSALEERLLRSQGGQERLAFARALLVHVDQAEAVPMASTAARTPWFRWLVAGLGAVAAIAAVVLFSLSGPQPGDDGYTIRLKANALRDAGAKRLLVMPAKAPLGLRVELILEAGEKAPSFDITVRRDGQVVASFEEQPRAGQRVQLRVPAEVLTKGRFVLTLSPPGRDVVAYYEFDVP